MPVEIISVGSEFIVQHHRNPGIAAIANHLLAMGVEVDYVSSVSAQESRLEDILRQAIARSTLVFVLAGVSSGEYDLSKKLLTRILKKRLVLDYKILDAIKKQFELLGEVMPRSVEKRALVPTDTELLDNTTGSVPGFLFAQEQTSVALFPANPQEVEAMVASHILPRLDSKTFRFGAIRGAVFKFCGIPIDQVKEWFKGLERESRQQLINYVEDGEEVSVIATVRGDMQRDVDLRFEALDAKIRKRGGKYLYGQGSQLLEEVVGALLLEKQKTLALAESCTGGLISHRLTNVPGSSAYFERGVVSYSNGAKISLLDVSPNIIEHHGAVSAETAIAMAEGGRWVAQTDVGLSVTGIAGPSGGTPQKPVGLVYIALAADQKETQCQKFRFAGDRALIKRRTAQTALNMLRNHLLTIQ